jgi:hypothetical protein
MAGQNFAIQRQTSHHGPQKDLAIRHRCRRDERVDGIAHGPRSHRRRDFLERGAVAGKILAPSRPTLESAGIGRPRRPFGTASHAKEYQANAIASVIREPLLDRKRGPAMRDAASIFRQMRGKSECRR